MLRHTSTHLRVSSTTILSRRGGQRISNSTGSSFRGFGSIRPRSPFRVHRNSLEMPPKRKRSSAATSATATTPTHETVGSSPPHKETPILPPKTTTPTARSAARKKTNARGQTDTNPDHNGEILDGQTDLRASPDADERGEAFDVDKVAGVRPVVGKANGVKKENKSKQEDSDSTLSDLGGTPAPSPAKKGRKNPTKSSLAAKKGSDEIKAFIAAEKAKKAAESGALPQVKNLDDEEGVRADPDADDDGPAEDVDVLRREAARPPPVNSEYLPLPWKGRLGYVSAFVAVVGPSLLMLI